MKSKIQHFTWLSTISPKRRVEILDECKVISWENPRKEIESYLKKNYREPIKIHRIIDEKKLLNCPTELLYDLYGRQYFQGRCDCGYEFCRFIGKEKNNPEDFKYCLGFGTSNIPGREKLVIIFECPECVERSYFHTNENWYYLFGDWIVDNSELI